MPLIISGALKKLGLNAESVSDVFLTHSDYDHTGGSMSYIVNNKVLFSGDTAMICTGHSGYLS